MVVVVWLQGPLFFLLSLSSPSLSPSVFTTSKEKNTKKHNSVFDIYQLLTMDILAFATMKNAANCDT